MLCQVLCKGQSQYFGFTVLGWRIYRRFNVYHSVTQKAIKFNLPEELEKEVIKNLGKRIIATGIVSYNLKGEPLSVQVKSIRTLAKNRLPSVDDILGMAPDFTEEATTEEFIQRLRGG